MSHRSMNAFLKLPSIDAMLFCGVIAYFVYSSKLQSKVRKESKIADISRLRPSSSIENPKMLAVTRIHKGSSSHMASVLSVLDFVRNSSKFASKVLICIGNEDSNELTDYINQLKEMLATENLTSNVILLPISPWGHFTFALNCAIQKAVDDDFNVIAFQSLEFRISTEAVAKLVTYLQTENVLVVGPAISGHDFTVGSNELRGRTCPWNTFALWSVPHLSMTGFPPVGDGFGPTRVNGGVEEVTAISLIQCIRPHLQALLVRMNGVEWETNFTDPVRAKYHENKMRSKDERPADQMHRLGIPSGHVLHIIDNTAL